MPSRFRFARSAVGVSAAAVFLVVLSADVRPAAAQGLTMTAAMEVSQLYRADAWQPVRIQLRNHTDRPVDGTAVVPLSHPSAPAAMQLPVSVPPRASVSVTVWGYFPLSNEQSTAEKRSGGVPPLTIAEWRGPDGALLARSEVLGMPIAFRGGEDAAHGERGEVVLLVSERAQTSGDAHDVDALVGHVADAGGLATTVAGVTRDVLPRQAAGLRAVKAVVLEAVDPESLDAAQRAALVAYLNGGGVVVVSAPVAAVGRGGSWFERHFPVRLIGSRETGMIETFDGGSPLKLRGALPIVEAIEGNGQVLLRGKDYVHVAVQPVGLGRVVFTSFPINALAEKQPQVAVLWEQLLGLRQPLWDWKDSQLGEARHHVLGGMIGRKVAPWAVAAGVAGGYVLLVVLAQALFLGPARPKAFVASAGVALVLSGALLAMGMSRRGDMGLQAARLAVVDVGPDSIGWQQESIAFVGADRSNMPLRAADERVMIRPALADAASAPAVRQQPFAVDNAGVYAERIERVWEAQGPADPTWRVDAVARFAANGLSLDVNNGLGATLEAPLLVWDKRALAMADLPAARSTVGAFQLNARQQFTGLGMITSDQAKRRAQVVAASLASANPFAVPARTPPMLIGWVSNGGAPLVHAGDHDAIETRSIVMVRTPLRIEPAAVGTTVSVPAAVVSVDTGRLPYDREKGESVPTPQPGSWRIAFAPPPEVGRVRPTRLTLTARVTLPAHRMTLRSSSGAGAPFAEWDREAGAKELVIDCSPGDYDKNGRITMTLDVQSQDITGSVPWQISDLGARIEAEVIGLPAPMVLAAPPRADASDESDGESADEKETP